MVWEHSRLPNRRRKSLRNWSILWHYTVHAECLVDQSVAHLKKHNRHYNLSHLLYYATRIHFDVRVDWRACRQWCKSRSTYEIGVHNLYNSIHSKARYHTACRTQTPEAAFSVDSDLESSFLRSEWPTAGGSFSTLQLIGQCSARSINFSPRYSWFKMLVASTIQMKTSDSNVLQVISSGVYVYLQNHIISEPECEMCPHHDMLLRFWPI